MAYLGGRGGRAEEATAVADEAVAAARAHGSPWLIARALYGSGRAFKQADPNRALRDLTEGYAYAKTHRVLFYEALIARELVGLESVHGDLETGLALFDATIDSQFRAGNIASLATTVAALAVLFGRLSRPEIAATIYGTSTHEASIAIVIDLAAALDHLRATLGDTGFEDCVTTGTAMERAEAVRYVRAQIQAALDDLPALT